jgi:signal transduction histidine kinase
MTPAATLSCTTAVVSALVGLAALTLSRGPGASALRWFANACFLAACFSAGNIGVGLPLADVWTERAARFTVSVAALHGAAWIVYEARSANRTLRRSDRWLMAGGCSLAVLGFIPGCLVSAIIVPRTAWWGVVYRDAMPTTGGMFAYGYFCIALSILTYRHVRRVRAGDHDALGSVIGLGAMLLTGVNDSLAASQVTHAPYLLDLGLMTTVLAAGASLARRFVENARALEASSQRLAATQQELVQRERLAAVGEMSAVVAHEVRNPIAIMFNALASLRREVPLADNPRASALVAILDEEADRLRRLVDDFLDFARPLSMRPGTIDAEALVRSAVQAAAAAVPSAREVAVRVDESAGSMFCDEQLVKHALVNLVTNALQSGSPRAEVEVLVVPQPDRIRFEVVDHGAGVPDSARTRLFSPFFTTRATGTGLGLSVVKRIAEAHGGVVEHRPTDGGGATFVLVLPRKSSPVWTDLAVD